MLHISCLASGRAFSEVQPGPLASDSPKQRSAEGPATATDMIIRLGRLTPGYFRLLQRQVAGEVQTQPQDRSINQLAMMLAIMGLSLSYYSAKQMTEKVQAQPAP
ncbi:putative transmembrane protein ZNF593OS isoform X2 [Synchiropus splendidus]|uniref:putative transmembrane protein ZNF593OS isoform X2 n=1 Tax=Synchiropus splendidus TaxID=270530 RepID=UPI00237E71C7|nr:putative transmembrane protein ZNF593OS isoform X2 [Synchiropus splendidus]